MYNDFATLHTGVKNFIKHSSIKKKKRSIAAPLPNLKPKNILFSVFIIWSVLQDILMHSRISQDL